MSSAPQTQEELTQLLQRVEERERTARRRAIFYSLVPIAVGALVLIVTTWQVYRAERDLATKKAELDFREKVIERLNPQRLPGGKVEGNTSARNEPTQQVSQVTPITANLKVRASAEEENGKVNADGSQLYKMSLWIVGSPETLARIASVQYEFNHPTFVQKIREGKDRNKGFPIEPYEGWGCLRSVIVTIKLVNPPEGPLPQIDFDMTAALGWS